MLVVLLTPAGFVYLARLMTWDADIKSPLS